MNTLTIGTLQLDAPLFQASLSGYSDRAMRDMARKFGAPLTFAGVMLAKMTQYPKALRKPAFMVADYEHPIGAQIMGNDPEIMAHAAVVLHDMGYDMIDMNFACPAPKVLRRQRGGYMMRQPERVIETFKRVRAAVDCPVTIKLRMAYGNSDKQNCENLGQICAAACAEGIDAIMVHGRTTLQAFKGKADWDILGRLKREFPAMTIIGSGDLFSAEDIVERLEQTGIDGVVVARGAIGNPWIFAETTALLQGQPKPPAPTIAEQGQIILEHFAGIIDLYQQKKTVAYFRKFAARYARRHPERKAVTLDLMKADNAEELRQAVKHWYGVE